jgi:hypothetical protein
MKFFSMHILFLSLHACTILSMNYIYIGYSERFYYNTYNQHDFFIFGFGGREKLAI